MRAGGFPRREPGRTAPSGDPCRGAHHEHPDHQQHRQGQRRAACPAGRQQPVARPRGPPGLPGEGPGLRPDRRAGLPGRDGRPAAGRPEGCPAGHRGQARRQRRALADGARLPGLRAVAVQRGRVWPAGRDRREEAHREALRVRRQRRDLPLLRRARLPHRDQLVQLEQRRGRHRQGAGLAGRSGDRRDRRAGHHGGRGGAGLARPEDRLREAPEHRPDEPHHVHRGAPAGPGRLHRPRRRLLPDRRRWSSRPPSTTSPARRRASTSRCAASRVRRSARCC